MPRRLPYWPRSLSVGLGALALAASGALAQMNDSAADYNVDERPRPEYDPSGIRTGGFTVFPSVEFGIGSDNNIYRQSRDPQQDSIRFVRPQIYGVSQWQNHEIEMNAGLDASYFEEAQAEDVTNWFAGASGRLDVTRDAWVSAALIARELHEERGDPNFPTRAASPVSRQLSSARVEAFQRVSRVSLGVEGSYTGIAYEDALDSVTGARLVQNDRNRSESEISARIAWDVAAGNEAYVRATRYVRRYDRPQGEDRYERDSDGTEVVIGSRLDLGAVIAGDLFAGYRSQVYEQDERLPAVEGVSYGGALTWNASPLTTLRGTARRTVDESTLRQASGYLASAFELALDHELRRNLLIGVSAGVVNNSYVGIAREDDIATGEIRGTWLMSRSLHAEFGYRVQRRDSTVERDDYEKNFVYLDVRLSL